MKNSPASLICRFLTDPTLDINLLSPLTQPWSTLAAVLAATPGEPAARRRALNQAIQSLPPTHQDRVTIALTNIIVHATKQRLTKRQLQVLYAVILRGPLQLPRIARLVAQDRGNTHRRLQSLVTRGLLKRVHQYEKVFYHPAL